MRRAEAHDVLGSLTLVQKALQRFGVSDRPIVLSRTNFQVFWPAAPPRPAPRGVARIRFRAK
jgi:hypothetical protein